MTDWRKVLKHDSIESARQLEINKRISAKQQEYNEGLEASHKRRDPSRVSGSYSDENGIVRINSIKRSKENKGDTINTQQGARAYVETNVNPYTRKIEVKTVRDFDGTTRPYDPSIPLDRLFQDIILPGTAYANLATTPEERSKRVREDNRYIEYLDPKFLSMTPEEVERSYSRGVTVIPTLQQQFEQILNSGRQPWELIHPWIIPE